LRKVKYQFLPPAARGTLFEKAVPLDPLQKLLIKGGHSLQPERIFMQTMTAFGSFSNLGSVRANVSMFR
jgi:hypothetical protein